MAHIVTTKCVGCKFTDCVEVCPVACFYELDNQLLIHPEDCIDCTACVAECPVEAIYAEGDVPASSARLISSIPYTSRWSSAPMNYGPSWRKNLAENCCCKRAG